jgi:DNA-binding CsgD family transcriptional regulator
MSQSAFEFFIPKNFPQRAQTAKLSPRETQIAELLISNEKRESIAASLGISPHTVDNHIRRIYGKLGIHDKTAAVVFFLKPSRT